MVGSLIGAGISAVGSIFGGIKASHAMKKAKREIERQRQQNELWYDRRYNEDATQRADAQRVLTMTEEAIKRRNRAAAGTQALTGGTEESVAAAKAANNEATADAASRIAANGDRRKDAIENQYRQRDGELQSQLTGMEVNRAHATSQAIQGVTSAAAGLGNEVDDWLDSRKKDNQ